MCVINAMVAEAFLSRVYAIVRVIGVQKHSSGPAVVEADPQASKLRHENKELLNILQEVCHRDVCRIISPSFLLKVLLLLKYFYNHGPFVNVRGHFRVQIQQVTRSFFAMTIEEDEMQVRPICALA